MSGARDQQCDVGGSDHEAVARNMKPMFFWYTVPYRLAREYRCVRWPTPIFSRVPGPSPRHCGTWLSCRTVRPQSLVRLPNFQAAAISARKIEKFITKFGFVSVGNGCLQ